jgi:hypothetical protein
MIRLAAIIVFVTAAGWAAGQDAADTAASPAYHDDLRRLAEQSLADTETETAAAPLARRVSSGPMSRAEYEQYVGEASFTGAVEADSVALTRPVIPRVVIRDREAIGYLFSCCAYAEAAADSVEFIEIYDVSNAGFSNGDMMVAHPSGNSYILEGLDAEFLESAAGWQTTENLRFKAFHRENAWMDALVDDMKAPETMDWDAPAPVLPPDQNEDQALRAIWGGLHQAVSDQYGEGRVELYFARDDTTTTVEFWGYDPRALQFNWLQDGMGGQGLDMLTVSVADTMTTAYDTYVDVLVVRESQSDTVYVPRPARRRP